MIAEKKIQNGQVIAVVIFGSVAKGEATEESAIDLLIVSEEMEDHQTYEDRIMNQEHKFKRSCCLE
ncbi:MAG: nucleotidyltransferase domain-containing protein [Candidatus Bathyarchaeia archaeon]